MTDFSPKNFRQHFPLVTRYGVSTNENSDLVNSIVYFDNAATTQKPQSVIDSSQNYYKQLNANVHRASHQLSSKATFSFEQSRIAVQQFIGAKSLKEIIWTKGATESINIITQSLARNLLKQGDEIVLCISEHHANIVPWQIVAEQTGAVIKILPISPHGYIDVNEIDNVITHKTKFVAFAHISNVLGKFNPIEILIKKAKSTGAISVIDGAQAVAHIPIDVQLLNCDFYVFSAHKMYGPSGVGVLYGKEGLLESMSPYQGGGEMIKKVSFNQKTTYNALPFKLEAGTPNIAGVIAFGATIHFLEPLINDANKSYQLYEQSLAEYCYQALSSIEQVKFIAQGKPDIGVFSFTLTEQHNHDVAMALDSYGIAVRSGHHCAMPLMEYLKIEGCIRVSIAPYNTVSEIDYFITCLKRILLEDSLDKNDELEKSKLLATLFNNKAKPEHSAIPTNITKSENTAKPKNPAVQGNKVDEILSIFSNAKGWDSRHREIMLLGKGLPRLDKTFRNETTIIAGCESLAWLRAEKYKENNEDLYVFSADSDAKIIRGLLVIVLAVFNNKTAEQIQVVDVTHYFSTLGLLQHLSPSRGNGLLAIVNKIRALAIPSAEVS